MMAFMPALFISHGSPMLALEDDATARFLRRLSSQLPRPKAIIAASAHWETDTPMLTGAPKPETIHDFHGFPKELHALRYPASGDLALAQLVCKILQDAQIDPARGLDHGVWNPLLLMYPEADIPVIELSVQPRRDARWHYRIGQALAPLRAENILVIGTGNLTHNLREAFRGYPSAPEWVTDFAKWVQQQVASGETERLLDWDKLAPYARENHPSSEHFLPFFIAFGAGGFPAKHLHEDTALGVLAMDAYAFG